MKTKISTGLYAAKIMEQNSNGKAESMVAPKTVFSVLTLNLLPAHNCQCYLFLLH